MPALRGDEYLVAVLLYEQAWVVKHQGQPGAALPLIDSGLDLSRSLRELHLTARLLSARSYAMHLEGETAGAALRKLGLSSRAAAAAWGVRTGLV